MELGAVGIAQQALDAHLAEHSGTDGHFGIDGWIGFGAVYGFLSCLVMVLVAKGLGAFLKRPDDYYANDQNAGGAGDD